MLVRHEHTTKYSLGQGRPGNPSSWRRELSRAARGEKVMAKRSIRAMIAVAVASISAAPAALAEGAAEEQFGKVHFSTSCNDQAQRRCDRAMRYQHSFWYRQPEKSSKRRSRPTPSARLLLGIALTLLLNPHIPAQGQSCSHSPPWRKPDRSVQKQRERLR